MRPRGIAIFVVLLAMFAAPCWAVTLSLQTAKPQIAAGEVVQVDLQIADVVNLYGYQVELSYPTDTLKFVDVLPGTFLSQGGRANTFAIDPDTREAGKIKNIVETLTGEGQVSGSGLLKTIRFVGKAEGSAAISITAAQLSNSAVQEIPVALGQPLVLSIQGSVPAWKPPVPPTQPQRNQEVAQEVRVQPMAAKEVPGERSLLFSFFLLLTALATLLIGGYAYLQARKKSPGAAAPPHEVVQPALAYVRHMRERGYDEATIMRQLKGAGWDDGQLRKLLSG